MNRRLPGTQGGLGRRGTLAKARSRNPKPAQELLVLRRLRGEGTVAAPSLPTPASLRSPKCNSGRLR